MYDLRQLIPGSLAAQARRLQALTVILNGILPANCRAHCEVIGCERGILTLAVDTPAWKTRLRFVEADIRRAWPASEEPLSQVRIRVIPVATESNRQRRREPVPPAAADQLRNTAGYLGHAGLAAALRRLAGKH